MKHRLLFGDVAFYEAAMVDILVCPRVPCSHVRYTASGIHSAKVRLPLPQIRARGFRGFSVSIGISSGRGFQRNSVEFSLAST
jgi:hypothetical protein